MKQRSTAGLVAALAVAVSSPSAMSAPPARQATATGVATQVSGGSGAQSEARNILMAMARFLGQARAFSVTVLSNYDTVQASGQKIEFSERRKVVVERPGRLRIETDQSNGSHTTIVFTGSDMVLVDVSGGVYASEPQPGTVDDGIVHFVSDLGMRLPLAVLLMARAPEELDRRVRTVDYVEDTGLLGAPARHLAARTDTVDFQVWISDGPQPVPLRVVITYRNEPGQPEFRAQFSDWNFAPLIAAATFQPQIPAGSQKLPFAAQLQAAVAKRASGGR